MSTNSFELLIYGFRACLALWSKRPDAVVRVYCLSSMVPKCKDILQACAAQKKAYHIVEPEALEKITSSVHHEGVAILARFPEPWSGSAFLQHLKKNPENGPLVFVDGVGNPHNLGAISRTMAHFGSQYLIGETGELPRLSASWVRLSEGGSESVAQVSVERKVLFLQELQRMGWALVGFSSRATDSLFQTPLPEKTVLVVGHEITGISRPVDALLSQRLRIPGTGAVASLNVGVATGIALGTWAAQHCSDK